MNHYVYRIDRPSTGEWYVGIRSCKCAPLEDVGYMGSGVRIKASIRKHGRDQFTKAILVQVQTRKEAARIERGLVGPDQVANSLCLNLTNGGGDITFTDGIRASMRRASRNRWGSPEARAVASEAQLLRFEDPAERRRMSAIAKDREAAKTDTVQKAHAARQRWAKPGARERTSEQVKAWWNSPAGQAAKERRKRK